MRCDSVDTEPCAGAGTAFEKVRVVSAGERIQGDAQAKPSRVGAERVDVRGDLAGGAVSPRSQPWYRPSRGGAVTPGSAAVVHSMRAATSLAFHILYELELTADRTAPRHAQTPAAARYLVVTGDRRAMRG